MSESISVEVAYATPEQQVLVAVLVPTGATVKDAITASGLLVQFPALNTAAVGVFGNVCDGSQLVSAGDRVEIYRALSHDPKEARRQRAAKR